MNVNNLACLPLLQILSSLCKDLTAVGLAFDQLSVHVQFLWLLLALCAGINLGTYFVLARLQNFRGLRRLNLFLSLALLEAFDLDAILESLEGIDLEG